MKNHLKQERQSKDIPAPHLAMIQEYWNTPPVASGLHAPVEKGKPLDGETGILSGAKLDGARVDRELAAERERDRVFAERELTLKKVLKDIDDAFCRSPYLAEKLNKQVTTAISSEAHQTFTKFQAFCASWNLPCFPPSPQALALFIIEEAVDADSARQTLSDVSSVLKRLDPPVYEDALVKVVVDAFEKDPEPKLH
jgi:hypothetical protein